MRFNDEVPTHLLVQMGAGESDLDLDSLELTGLVLEMGAGRPRWTSQVITQGLRCKLTRRGWRGNGALTQRGRRTGEGRGATRSTPRKLGRGDSYVNSAYGDSDVSLDVEVQGGVGEINLEVV